MAREHLTAVTHAVDKLRGVFQEDPPADSEVDEAVAADVLAACSKLSDWLRSGHTPRGFARAEGELGAAGGVYRNAAVAFKSLAEVEGAQRQARSRACATLLEQGDHHVELFEATLAKKLGDNTPQ